MAPKKLGLINELKVVAGGDINAPEAELAVQKPIKIQGTYAPVAENTIGQCDLIYMPKDQKTGDLYLMTVIDIVSHACDAIPLKGRTPEDIIEGWGQVKRNKYIKIEYLYTDPGSEFNNAKVKDYFKKEGIIFRQTMAGRKNQVAVVETFNGLIKKVLSVNMTTEELKTNQPHRLWAEHVKPMIKLLNKKKTRFKEKKIENFMGDPKITPASAKQMLKEGDWVHHSVQKPKGVLSGEQLVGKKRTGDLQYSREAYRIDRVCIYPNQPVRYILEGLPNVSFVREELVVAHEKFAQPAREKREKDIAEKEETKKREVEDVEKSKKFPHMVLRSARIVKTGEINSENTQPKDPKKKKK